MRYAIVDSNRQVVNIAEWDGETPWAPEGTPVPLTAREQVVMARQLPEGALNGDGRAAPTAGDVLTAARVRDAQTAYDATRDALLALDDRPVGR